MKCWFNFWFFKVIWKESKLIHLKNFEAIENIFVRTGFFNLGNGFIKRCCGITYRSFSKILLFVLLFLQFADVKILWPFNLGLTWLHLQLSYSGWVAVSSVLTISFLSLSSSSKVQKNGFHKNVTAALTKNIGKHINYTKRGVFFSVDSWTMVRIFCF